jgi:hypothetical protein
VHATGRRRHRPVANRKRVNSRRAPRG